MAETLVVNEIFHSIQGEGLRVGAPCVFVRLTGCHLRCGYCDTEYAFHEGRRYSVPEVREVVEGFGCPLVEVTGGEPLLQPAIHPLMTELCDHGTTVLVETSGACDISTCDKRVIRIMDVKTPGSGEVERMDWQNMARLDTRDEAKFVICDRSDYEWSRQIVREHQLVERGIAVLFSPVYAMPPGKALPGATALPPKEMADWVLQDRLHVRVQLQLHKMIWDPMARGV